MNLCQVPKNSRVPSWVRSTVSKLKEKKEENVAEREADAKSGPAEHEAPQPHRSPANRPFRRGDPHHRCSRHLLRVQHRPQPMGTLSLSLSLLLAAEFFIFAFSDSFILFLSVFDSFAEPQGR